MKTHLVSFASWGFYKNQKRLEDSARQFGIDEIHTYTYKDLQKSGFVEEHQELFKYARGKGYWIWKPYVILDTLKKLNEGDLLLYVDSGAEIINHLDPLLALIRNYNIVLFRNHNLFNSQWTKRDLFIAMNLNYKEIFEKEQVVGGFIGVKKCNESNIFLNEFYNWCSNYNMLNDAPSISPNLPDFVEHRHDQSILSLLSIRHNIIVFPDPTQFGNHILDRPYPQLFNLHRNKTISYKIASKLTKMLKTIH